MKLILGPPLAGQRPGAWRARQSRASFPHGDTRREPGGHGRRVAATPLRTAATMSSSNRSDHGAGWP
jgi:hypothetical protein